MAIAGDIRSVGWETPGRRLAGPLGDEPVRKFGRTVRLPEGDVPAERGDSPAKEPLSNVTFSDKR
jgi:hypothetical protein